MDSYKLIYLFSLIDRQTSQDRRTFSPSRPPDLLVAAPPSRTVCAVIFFHHRRELILIVCVVTISGPVYTIELIDQFMLVRKKLRSRTNKSNESSLQIGNWRFHPRGSKDPKLFSTLRFFIELVPALCISSFVASNF
ncbi:hypothetical protein F2Q68_00043678 [Brassica cretica]|uniref:Uncharacterized protein n=3 Tax=Brassica TaxID=3705 RepID=A0A8S9LNZ4_BRACR|nr:hypothetical protein F2Q68_00043678 [Brassica cretica]